MKHHITVKTVKQANVKATLRCAVLGLGALFGGASWKAATTASRACEAVQAWEDKGLHANNVWGVRGMLARQGWLGPLRPSPPLDPLETCGVVPGEASACWWRLLLQPRQAGRLLACLEERTIEAEKDYEAFRARLCWGIILALVVPLALMAAHRIARRWLKRGSGQQESPSADCFEDARETLLEEWATPAADVDVTQETCTAVESTTPTALSSAVEDSLGSKGVKNPEEINVLATAENVECEEVKDESSGKVYTEMKITDDNADSKIPDKAEEAAEVSPVPDDFGEERVVSEDPDSLADQEPQSNSLEAEGAPCEGKAERKKKRKRKRKKLDPTNELKASAQVKDDHKTDAKTEVKKKAALKNEAKANAVPKEEVMDKAKSVKNDTVKVTRKKKKPAPAQPKKAAPSPPLHSVRQSWQEDVVTVRLPVPPARRRHVIGPRGDMVQQLRRDYPGVHVAVPLPKDADAHVTFTGPKSQAAAASGEVAAHLQAIDAQIREAARRRQQAVATVVLDVAPNRRRLVVGPGGEELLKLQQQHPGVRVSVPPAINTESRKVTIRGPPAEVHTVQAKIKNRLAAIERHRQFLRANRRRRPRGAPKAPGASQAKYS